MSPAPPVLPPNECPSCSAIAPPEAVSCPRCGAVLGTTAAPLADDSAETRLRGPSVPSLSVSSSGIDSSPHGLFVPGQIIAGRYRIVGRLGSGGMGDVYRADDLRLGQTVALKFLPPNFASDPRRLAVFHNEVRIAREVSHPNVCRVHDIGEVEGHVFLSMEYIDGEDLGSLLRRIGRVPHDKALEIARQICAGLAAAHQKDVLHRDLKPGNVMIDGRGRARIADFGLAALTGTVGEADIRSGTPIYMAPEQLAGHEVTKRSDIYGLGMVLYELFTGRRAIEAKTVEDVRRHHVESSIAPPSDLVGDLDPAVERVILRCMDRDPARRPSSALAVAAALPGGDPLAAALAAGETPSPELVAAAGEEGALRKRAAWAWMGVAVLALLAWAAIETRHSMLALQPLPLPPDALAERARQVLASAGHEPERRDWSRRFFNDRGAIDWLSGKNGGPASWQGLFPEVVRPTLFRYRQSSAAFEPINWFGFVGVDDPPHSTPGVSSAVLRSDGRLVELFVAPPQHEADGTAAGNGAPAADTGAAADYAPLIAAAGLDPAALQPAAPEWSPPFFADSRAAWTGTMPGDSRYPLRVEAASYRGKPSYFLVVDPWVTAARATPPEVGLANLISILIIVAAIVAAGLLARHNVRLGRGDRRGAWRLAAAVVALAASTNLLRTQMPQSVDAAWDRLSGSAALGLFLGTIVWLLYLALEPIVRKSRPEVIVSWSRFIAGRWSDPLVGRDLLIGSALGLALSAVSRLRFVLPGWLGLPATLPYAADIGSLSSVRDALSAALNSALGAVFAALLMTFFVALGTRTASTRRWGIPLFFAIALLMTYLGMEEAPLAVRLPLSIAGAAIYSLVFVRFGLVAGFAMVFFLSWRLPFPTSPQTWYFGTAAVLLLAALALPVWGLLRSLGASRGRGGG